MNALCFFKISYPHTFRKYILKDDLVSWFVKLDISHELFDDKHQHQNHDLLERNHFTLRLSFSLFLDERDEYNIDEREVESQKMDVVAALRELIEDGKDIADNADKSRIHI